MSPSAIRVTRITKATCCLYNYLKLSGAYNQHQYCPPGYTDQEDKHGNCIPGDSWLQQTKRVRNIQCLGSHNCTDFAAELHDTVMDHLVVIYPGKSVVLDIT